MGFRFRQQIGPKGFKINIGQRGISSVSTRIAPGITHNSSRGTTLGIPGTGMSYNVCNTQTRNNAPLVEADQSQDRLRARLEYNRGWNEFTGGYSRKAMIAVAVSLVLCVTPLWPLGPVLSIPFLLWFAIDTLVKVFKYRKHLDNNQGLV